MPIKMCKFLSKDRSTQNFFSMGYNWHQLIKLGKRQVLELAKELGVYNRAIASFKKKQKGAYFKAASVVYQALKNIKFNHNEIAIGRTWMPSSCFRCIVIPINFRRFIFREGRGQKAEGRRFTLNRHSIYHPYGFYLE